MAGTSKKEHAELTRQHQELRAAAWTVESRANIAARDALDEAWKILRASDYAHVLQIEDRRPDTPELALQRLEEMRGKLPDVAHRVDTADENKRARLNGEIKRRREEAADHRAYAALARAEQAQRREIAEKFPQLHDIETGARQAGEQTRNQSAQHQAAPAVHPQQSRGTGRNR